MTGIDFHFNTPDKVGYACRLLRKAVGARGARVVVVADAELLEAVDLALWTFAPTEFIAHCRSDGDPGQLARSPVVLAERGDAALPHRQVLVNLGLEVPGGFERFERLIDVVSADDADRQAGRRRWRHYADRGYAIQRHDFAGSNA
ncbi:DNA polymerase III subunit chi [Variovorax sp. JS1663]|uniref:DNA polymerase III subunit chi n=1 Tax=Variovorax sp. JS1663 TaxID=1851577 RepID=UPI000B342B04|nr:DNA polymerase III subunit chi [Variovorax sp. JS1663]OUM01902.1 DNA polymerase III subunit chi [Variovorax sp. JS1663]